MKKIIILFVFIIIIYKTYAQNSFPQGAPFITNYTSKQYKADPKNWFISQGNEGLIYVANSKNLLIYDGQNWHKIFNDDVNLYSLEIDKSGTVFLGFHRDFGVIEKNNFGKHTYKSLGDKLNEKVGTFAKILSDDMGIYFFATDTLIYYYDYKNITPIHFNPKLKLFWGFKVNNQVYVIQEGIGLSRLEGTKTVKVHDSPVFEDIISKPVFSMIGYSENKILVFSYIKGMYLIDLSKKDKIEAVESDANEFLVKNRVYGSVKMPNGDFAIASLQSGVIILDSKLNLKQIISKRKGLNSNVVYNVTIDRDENLWAALEDGMAKIEISVPFYTYSDKNELAGTLTTGIQYGKDIYIGSSMGIYKLKGNDSPMIMPVFENISKKYTIARDFQEYSDKTQPNLTTLFATSMVNVIQIEPDTIKPLLRRFACKNIHFPESDPNRFFVSHSAGVNIFEYDSIVSSINNIIFKDMGELQGIPKNIHSIYSNKVGDILVGSYENGSYFLSKQKGYEYKVIPIDTSKGLPDMDNNRILKYNDQLLIECNKKGLYTYNKNTDKVEAAKLDFTGRNDKIHTFKDIFTDNNGNVYTTNNNRLSFYKKNGEAFIREDKQFLRLPEEKISDIFFDSNNNAWIIYLDKVYLFDVNKLHLKQSKPYYALIEKVTTSSDSVIALGFYSDNTQGNKTVAYKRLDYKQNSLIFYFSAPYFNNEDEVLYQYKLKGFDNDWGAWTSDLKKEYTNLKEGPYTFSVRAKNIYGQISETANFSFGILAPWYRTVWAYFAYVVLSIALVYFIVKWNSQRLIKANIRLEQQIHERTKEIREKNSILEQQKEEISTQAELLATRNADLRKLSIVASKTDNSVMIMDENGKFEWVNSGFERLYGYTFQDFVSKFGDSLNKISTNHEIDSIIAKCVDDKKSVIYESYSKNKFGEELWLQTTLTPVLDSYDNVEKIVAIESDIKKLKKAEQEILQQKQILEQKNEEITTQRDELESQNIRIEKQKMSIQDSIRYARRIQGASLPNTNLLKTYFDFFILYKPKDIVSGDFYWFSDIKHENYRFVAVVDCTGHGVPGAFMSLIGNSLLNAIVNERNIYEPDIVLKELNKGILNALEQEDSKDSEVNDGMDICLCRFCKNDEHTTNVRFAGAKRPLIIWRSAYNKIEQIKGTRKSLGGAHNPRNKEVFTNHDVEITNEDVIYLTSDGYIDQNNIERKRFGTNNFFEIINKIGNQPLSEQKKILSTQLNNYMGAEAQRDDITVLGLKCS